MLQFPDLGEFQRQGGRQKFFVHKEKPWLLHINGHRSESTRKRRGHD